MCDFSSHPAAAACRERAFKQRKREQTNYSLHIVTKNMSSGPNYIFPVRLLYVLTRVVCSYDRHNVSVKFTAICTTVSQRMNCIYSL